MPDEPEPTPSSEPPERPEQSPGSAPLRELLRIAPVIDELGARFDRAGEQIALVGGPVRDAMLGRLHNDLDFTTSARPEVTEQLLAGLGGRDLGHGPGVRHDRLPQGRLADRDHDVPLGRPTTPDSRKPEVEYGDSLDGRPGPARLHRQRDGGDAARAASSWTRTAGWSTWRTGCCARPAARGLVLRRPAADDARRPVRRPARLHRRPGGGRGDDRHGRPDRRSSRPSGSATSWSSWSLAPHPRRGLALLVETGLAEHVLPELPALALERDEHHRHKDVYEHTLTVLEQAIELEDRLPGGGPGLRRPASRR